jgi:hypothetical protein
MWSRTIGPSVREPFFRAAAASEWVLRRTHPRPRSPRLGEPVRQVDVVVPGHGAVAEGPEVAARLAADHAYVDALRRGEEPADARLGPDADWLSGPRQSNLERARGR